MPRSPPHCHGNLLHRPVLRLLAVSVLLAVGGWSVCPGRCRCQGGGRVVQCQGEPEDYPEGVLSLSITNTVLPILTASTFQRNGSSLHNLSSLVLTNLSLQSIEAGAFSDLPSLTTLDLSLNTLHLVPEDTFLGLSRLQVLKMNRALQEPARVHILTSRWARPLRSLQTLELSSNGLHAFPSALRDLENLQEVHLENNSIQRLDEEDISVLRDKKTLLYLSLNPIVCDCRVKDLVTWLQNSSQMPDVHQLRCAEPPDMNGSLVLSINVLRLKCKNEDLETASYVFFGIVLALIGVIFLMVLYLNRRGIKRWMNNFREACRDQMEGYHYRYEQDSDPRRSNASTGI